MFCSKCGKTIDDNATFCGFCGASTGVAPGAAPNVAPQPVAPQPVNPQNGVPQYTAPQNNMPQYGAPQNGMYQQPPQPQQQGQFSSGFSLSLDPKMIDIINKSIRGALALLSVLVIIGAIGSMAVAGSISTAFKTGITSGLGGIQAFYGLARVPAIIAFVISIAGLVFTVLTKQRSLFSYISAGAGVILFIFNFVLYGGYVTLYKSLLGGLGSLFSSGSFGGPNISGIVVSGIFLLLGALVMIASSVIIIMNKEDLINYKPKH